MRDELVERVARFSARERLFRNVKQAMVAVSGGPDSVALLLVMRELGERLRFEVAAAHFDHQLRPGSHAEMEGVRELCASLGVPCFTGEGDVRTMARERGLGIEDAARRMRYQFMAFVAAEKRMDCIATGHTADDQAETILMRVVRGSGVRGLRGMLPASGVPGAEAQRLVRPLLEVSRQETRALCLERGVAFFDDPSNEDLAYARNTVRMETMPALERLNPSVSRALIGLGESAREAFRDIERASFGVQPQERGGVGSIFGLAGLRALPTEAVTLVLEREAAFYHLETEVNRTRLENLRAVLAAGRGAVRFADLVVEASCGKVRVGPAIVAEQWEGRALNVPGVTDVGAWRVAVHSKGEVGGPSVEVDASAVRGALQLRPTGPGDRMRYRGFTRKISDIYSAAKVPAWERPGAVALADDDRVHVLWTAGATFTSDIPEGAERWRVELSTAG